jgi:hypothetical protein
MSAQIRYSLRKALLGLTLVLVAATAACDDDDNTGPNVPESLAIVSGDDQDAVVGNAAEPFLVEVKDDDGDPLAGVEVVWSVTTGQGTLAEDTTDTGTNGRAQTVFTPTAAGAA